MSYSRIAVYSVLGLVLWHYASRLLLYLTMRVSCSYMNPFTFEVVGASVTRLGHTAQVGRTRLVVNFFSSKHKLITLRVSDIDLALTVVPSRRATKRPHTEEAVDIEDFLKDLDFEYDKPLDIFPDNAKLRWLTTSLARYLPSTEIQIVNLNVHFKESESALFIRSVTVTTDAITESDKRSVSVFSGIIKGPQTKFLFSYATVKSMSFTDESQRVHPLVDLLNMNLGVVIDLHAAFVYSLRNTVRATGVNVPVYPMMYSQHAVKQLKPPKESAPTEFSQKNALGWIYVMNSCLKMLDEIDFSLDRVSIDQIPILSSKDISQSFSSLEAYQSTDAMFASVGLKAFSVSFSKLRFNNAGFDLHFDKLDKPRQLLASLTNAKVVLDVSHYSHVTRGETSQFEVFSVPGLNFSVNSNILFQGLKALSSKKSSRAILSVDCSVWNPILDISSTHLGVLVSKFKEISSHNKETNKENAERLPSSKLETLKEAGRRLFDSAPPSLTARLSVEKPTFIQKHIDEESNLIYMLVTRPSVVSCALNTINGFDGDAEYYGFESRCDISGLNVSFSEKQYEIGTTSDATFDKTSIKRVAGFKDVRLWGRCLVVPEIKVSFKGEFDDFFVDLSEVESLNGITTIFDHAKWKIQAMSPPASAPKPLDIEALKVRLFRELPSWVNDFELHGRDFDATLGSRSVLLPPELVAQFKIPGGGDTVNGSLRKVLAHIAAWDITAKGRTLDPDSEDTESAISSAISSDSGDSYLDFWRLKCNIRGVVVHTLVEKSQELDKLRRKRFFKLNELAVVLRGAQDLVSKACEVLVDVDLNKVELDYNIAAHFIVVSSVHLLKNTVLKSSKPKREAPKKSVDFRGLVNLFRTKLTSNQAAATVGLPDDFSVKLDFVATELTMAPDSPAVFTNQSTRLHVQSPTVPEYWSRFVSFQSNELLLHLDKLLKGEIRLQGERVNDVVELSNSGTVVSIPNEFVIHRLFDTLGTLVKGLKQIHHSLKTNSNECCIQPKTVKPVEVPRMKLRTKRFAFGMVDDPFEVELGMIFQLGLLEQRNRLAKIEEFNEKVKAILKETPQSPLTEDLTRLHERVQTSQTEKTVSAKSSRRELLRPIRKDDRSGTHSSSRSRHRSRPGSSHGAQFLRDELDHKMYVLRKNLQLSWIRLVTDFKTKRELYTAENGKTLWNLQNKLIPPELNAQILAMPENPPLVSFIVEDAELTVKPPTFPMEQLPDFIFTEGKGMPRDTLYSLLIPVSLETKAREVRAHLRDYPLPLCYIPRPSAPSKEPAVTLNGNFVIAEQFYADPSNVRHVHLPLVPGAPHGSEFFSLDVPRTIASVKIIANADFNVLTDQPTTFSWGVSYTPAIQQVMMNLDAFSKPQLDPSEKLGVWDKVRSIMHGHASLNWNNQNEVRVALKASNDPYQVLGTAAGFVLSFRKRVKFDFNKTGDSRDFLVVDAEEVLWAIPNHVSQPLTVWSNRSSKSVFLPGSETFFASTYGYFLDNTQNEEFGSEAALVMSKDFYAKVVLKLRGQIRFKLGFLFERKLPDGSRVASERPHYDLRLCHPDYVERKESYDAYEGFRTEYIHMAISLIAPGSSPDSMNSIHLSPNTFQGFFSWWNSFGANVSLPTRNGTLFGPKEPTKKFGAHLVTIKFQFLLEPLFLFHGYRGDLIEPATEGVVDMVGLKAKIDSFSVDLHQRKEMVVKHNSQLDTYQKVMKMKMYLGEIVLENVDIRVIEALFKLDLESSGHGEHVLRVFDDDVAWFDILDAEEEGLSSVKGMAASSRVLPFVFAPTITYKRDTDHGEATGHKGVKPFGDEPSHECRLGKHSASSDGPVAIKHTDSREGVFIARLNEHLETVDQLYGETGSGPEESRFNNMFALDRILLKWNCGIRNLVFKYFHYQGLRKAYMKYGRYQASKVAGDAIDARLREDSETETQDSTPPEQLVFTTDDISCAERVASFQADLRTLTGLADLAAQNEFAIALIGPQIQLATSEEAESCVLVTSPKIDVNIVSVVKLVEDENGRVVEMLEPETQQTRFGAFLKDANVVVLYKDDVDALAKFSLPTYGSNSHWPPWLSPEVPNDIMDSHTLLEETSMVLRYDKVDALGYSNRSVQRDRIIFDVPRVAASCDSRQYFAFFVLVVDLLIYSEPSSHQLNERLQKLMLSVNLADLEGIKSKFRKLQNEFNTLQVISKNFDYRRSILPRDLLDLATEIRKKKAEVSQELFLLMKLVTTGISQGSGVEWTIRADEIAVSMLEQNRRKFIELFVEKGGFRRIEEAGGSNTNIIEVGHIRADNQYDKALFPELLSSFDYKNGDTNAENEAVVSWSMESPVGGIKVIRDFDIKLQPLKVQLDEATGEGIMRYLFPEDLDPVSYAQSEIKTKSEGRELENDLERAVSRREGDAKSDVLTVNPEESVVDDETLDSDEDIDETASVTSSSSSSEYGNMGEMIDRASSYFSLVSVNVHSVVLCISFRGSGLKRLINVFEFVLKLPEITFENKLWGTMELVEHLKRVVVKALLAHSSSLIGNKLKIHSRRRRLVRHLKRKLKEPSADT